MYSCRLNGRSLARFLEGPGSSHLNQVFPFAAFTGSHCEEERRSNLVRFPGLKLLRYARNDTAGAFGLRESRASFFGES